MMMVSCHSHLPRVIAYSIYDTVVPKRVGGESEPNPVPIMQMGFMQTLSAYQTAPPKRPRLPFCFKPTSFLSLFR